MAKIKNVSPKTFWLLCSDDRGRNYQVEMTPSEEVEIPDKTYIDSYDVRRLLASGVIITTENPEGFTPVDYSGVTASGDIEFDSDEYVDVEIDTNKANDLVIGRVYIDDISDSAFYNIASVIMYNHPDKNDDDIVYLSEIAFVYTQLANPAGSGNDTLVVDDADDLIDDQLLFIKKAADNEFRRIESIASNTVTLMANLENSYNANDGVSSVAEIGNFSIVDRSGGDKIYMRIKFDSSQTVTMKYDFSLVV